MWQSASTRAEKTNAARGVGQRRTRSLQFPHARFTYPAGEIQQKSTQSLTRHNTGFVLSLHYARNSVLGNCLSKGETRFKPLFFVRGSKVPPERKQAVRKSVSAKNLYKNP